jgi:hypothetical protein
MAQGWSVANILARFSVGQERRGEMLFGTAPEAPTLLANIVRVQQRFGL